MDLVDPYKGLMPYGVGDANIFFGRDRDRKIIASNLLAQRFTLLYGPSGVGKTSVLRAGVVHDLRMQAERNLEEVGLPEFAVAWVSRWRGDPTAVLDIAVRKGVASALGGDGGPVSGDTMIERLRNWTKRLNGDLLLLFDQFEEYFLYHPDPVPGGFEDVLVDIARAQGLNVHVMVSLRDDALSQMDRFKGRIPELFDNYLRIDRLDREAGREAILGPVEHWNSIAPTQMSVEPKLTEKVLDQVSSGDLGFGERGRGALNKTRQANAKVETPYLQLVMQRIWEEERETGSTQLRARTLDRLGGASTIIQTHLDRVMRRLSTADREVAQGIFYYLVTPSGAKIAHSAADLSDYTGEEEKAIARVLERLCEREARVLRTVAVPDDPDTTRFEIYHDVLGAAILDWQRRLIRDEEQRAANLVLQRRQAISNGVRTFLIAAGCATALVYTAVSLSLAGRAEQAATNSLTWVERVTATAQAPEVPDGAYASVVGTGPDALWGLVLEAYNGFVVEGVVEISRSNSIVILRLSGNVGDGVFEPGRNTLTPEAEARLTEIALGLRSLPLRKVTFRAHTDSVPLAENARYPDLMALSEARARAARTVVEEVAQLPEDKVFEEGLGDTEPLTSNDTREGRALNRRLEIWLE
ncbi:MAG: OmpA family protein [Pseudomonadota bacterium]